jgi:rubrerythrin
MGCTNFDIRWTGGDMIRDAVETAIKMETDAISFYEEAVNRTAHPFGKEMFRGFVKDETRHLKMLQQIFKGLDIEADFIRPKETIKTVFSRLKDSMMQKVKAMESELEALNIALKFEKEGYDFYKDVASRADSGKEKELFERLAEEENDHYRILNETYSFLDNTGHWYMYEERGIVEG